MAKILLEYDLCNMQAMKTLEYILSLGLFKPTAIGIEDTIREKRKRLDSELDSYLIDLSNFKFDREDANIYE